MPRRAKTAPTPPTAIKPTNLPTGQGYGARGGEARSLQALPVPSPTPTPTSPANLSAVPSTPASPGTTPSPMDAHQAALAAAQATPFTSVGLGSPTSSPHEPITAGLPVGAGPSTPPPLIAPQAHPDDQILANLYAAYRAAPNDALARIITQMESNRGSY